MADNFIYLDTGEIFAIGEEGEPTGAMVAIMGAMEPEEADRIGAMFAAAPDLLDALEKHLFAVALMNAAMKDGINVQGAVSALVGAEDIARAAIASARGAK